MSKQNTFDRSSERFRLNEPAVIADVIDGEAVVMNLERGSYCSLNPMGTEIWRRIVEGVAPGEIADVIVRQFEVERMQVEKDLGNLLVQMVEEDLIVSVSDRLVGGNNANGQNFAFGGYATPVLTVYRDMKDVLAFDPPLPDYDAKLPE